MRTAIHLFIISGFSPRLVLLVALSLSLLGSPAVRAATVAEHDVTVLVLATGPGPDRVAISYSHVVDHSQLAAGVQALAREAGVNAGAPAMREEPVLRGSQEKATSAEFTAPGLVSGRAGPLPVEEIARSLPDWQRMRLVFAVGERYRFAGPQSGTGDGYRLELVSSAPAAYQYDVERTNREQQAQGETGEGQGGGSSPAPGGGVGSFWGGIRLALIGLSAAAAGAAIWILVRAFRTKD